MTKASDNLFPKVILNEAATDGSDFSNPSADYRVLFLGEDGALHLKDSSGTVTDVGGAGGAVATDAIWDAAGDLAVGSGANTAAKLSAGSEGEVLTIASGVPSWEPASGGGADWTQVVNEDGTSFANFTAASGTWSSNGTEIIQTDNTNNARRAKYNTSIPLGFGLICEAEYFWPTAGQAANNNQQAGLLLGFDGTNAGGLSVLGDDGATGDFVEIGKNSTGSIRNITFTFARDTWYKQRVVWMNGIVSVYINGTLIGNAALISGQSFDTDPDFFGLFSYGASVKFRNIKAWILSANAPA